jgi:hypothetical protein
VLSLQALSSTVKKLTDLNPRSRHLDSTASTKRTAVSDSLAIGQITPR